MEKERQEALEWFVQFANLNLNELRPGDRAKLLVESTEHLFPTKELQGLPPFQSMSLGLKPFVRGMEWAFKEPPQRDSEEYWSLVLHLQNVVKGELWQLAKTYVIPKKRVSGRTIYDATQIIPWEKIWAETVMVHSEVNPKKFIFSYIPLGKTHDDYIRIKLNLLLNGLPRSTLNRCPAPIRIRKRIFKKCDKFFLNFSLREKKFCSPRCMWRFNAAERRKDNPKAYREYQKAVMADKYRIQKGLKPKKFYKSKNRKEG